MVRWPVPNGSPDGVSVCSNGNILIAVRDTGQLVIFTPTGKLVKQIRLPLEMVNLRHSIQLDGGGGGGSEFLLCHGWGSSAYGICVVDGDGRVVRSSPSSSSASSAASAPAPGSFSPTHLAVDRHGNVLVAEFNGNAVQLYDKRLNYVGDVVARSAGLKRPFRLHLDATSGRLYVGEYNGGCRVLIFGR